jgi:hypothetical protein
VARIALYSDLHLEFGSWTPPKLGVDVVVLAGDTYTKNRGVIWEDARDAFGCPVILAVCGNHEHYSGKVDTTVAKTKPVMAAKGVTLLENEEIVAAGVRFLCATLWADFRLFAGDDIVMVKHDANLCVGDRYSRGLNDFRCIRVAKDGYRRFRPLDAATIHTRTVAWLDERLAVPHDGPTVVVTHHAPSLKCVPQKWLNDRLTAAYASNLDWLIEKHQPDAWCSGHIHDNVPEFRIGATRILSNPRGYWPSHLNPNFRSDFVIEV